MVSQTPSPPIQTLFTPENKSHIPIGGRPPPPPPRGAGARSQKARPPKPPPPPQKTREGDDYIIPSIPNLCPLPCLLTEFLCCCCCCCWDIWEPEGWGCLAMTRISKASTRDLSAAFSFVRYLLRFSRWAMYSVALDSTVAYTNTNQPPLIHVLYIYKIK